MDKLKNFILIFLISFAILGTGVNLFIGCGPDGDKCDTCDNDDDCNGEMFCSLFTDGVERCAKSSSTKCNSYGYDKKETKEVSQFNKEKKSNAGGITNPY